MWVVADEEFDRTLVDYALLIEREYLEDVQAQDARYHLAMMITQGFNGGAQVIWDERREWRSGLASASSPTPQLTDDLMRRAAALFKKMRAAEARHGAH